MSITNKHIEPRYKIEISVEGRQRTISIVDMIKKVNNNPTVLKMATVWRAPFSGGRSQTRTDMEEECKKLNKEHDLYQSAGIIQVD